MRYLGSKRLHARHLVPILMDGHDDSLPYIEPFVGGGNMIQRIPASIRLGYDIDADAIALLDALANGWLPPETLSEQERREIKQKAAFAPEQVHPAMIGFAKFCCSFGGKGWGTFARSKGRDLPAEQSKTLRKEAERLRGCVFACKSYREVDYPNGSTVYMDPPYAGSAGYVSGRFDHAAFWTFARRLSKRRRVFVSEYTAPEGWEPVWQKDYHVNFASSRDKAAPRTEKLFVWRG